MAIPSVEDYLVRHTTDTLISVLGFIHVIFTYIADMVAQWVPLTVIAVVSTLVPKARNTDGF